MPQERDLSITGLNEYGDGTGRERGRVIKVARTVPGDLARVRLPDSDKRYVQADLVRLVRPSPQRVDPGCPAFSAGCGGCQWLGLDYAEQLAWKTRIVRDLLNQRLPEPVAVAPAVPMAQPEAYRNKLSLRAEGGRFVFMQEFGGASQRPERCRVETPANQELWRHLRREKPPAEVQQAHLRSGDDGRAGLCLFTTKTGKETEAFAARLMAAGLPLAGVGAADRSGWRHLAGAEWVEHTVQAPGDPIRFRIALNGFFQTNYVQADALLGLVMDELAPRSGERLLDLYCGAGFFTLPLARAAGAVTGIESNADSVRAAGENARLNGISRARFVAADVAAAIREAGRERPDAVLLDPPRSGCAPEVLAELDALAPRRIVYVSCDPGSLARDLKALMAGGRWRVAACRPLDMFPHTHHVETVVRLERRGTR